nr:hypothetical protein [Tanacetum cinerariifolium]
YKTTSDPADYPADRGEEGDDEDESSDDEEDESSDDYEIEDIDIEGDEPQTPRSLPSGSEIARLMAIHTPPPSPISPLSSSLPQIPSPPLPLLSPPPTDPTYEEEPLGYRLFRDRRFYAHTARLMKGEARASPDRIFQTTVGTQLEEIRELRSGHRKLQAQFIRVLTALKSYQTQLTVALGRIQILEIARVPAQPEKMAPKRTFRANPATTTTTTTTSMTDAQLEALIEQGVARALAACDADINTNGNDSHNSRTGAKRTERVTRECTYPDFMKCKPLNFKGTEGVVELTQWFENMETMFRISNCSVENQIKFSTCTLLGSALTWWNSHVTTVGPDAAYVMTWVDMKKKMTDKAYTAGFGEKKPYGGSKPLCPKCNYYHDGPCALKGYNHCCAEKIVRIPWGNEIVIVHGDGSDRGNETHLNIISCAKTQ